MKKIMVLAVAMFAMATATFAADEETNATAAYNMNIKMSSLADALSLNIDQVEAVADVHKNFTADMMNAATAKGEDRSAMIDKAVLKDLKYMHVILDNSQYRKYVMLLNTNPKGKKNPSQDKTLTGILILNLSLIFLIYKKMITSNHG